jgi:hypothetical protein
MKFKIPGTAPLTLQEPEGAALAPPMAPIPPIAATRSLSILIVTYNSAGQISPLLQSLRFAAAARRWQVIVVDNASHDGTAEVVRQRHPWVKLVCSEVNLGFAAGNNLAARHADGQVLLLLNPDALVRPETIELGVQRMLAEPGVGIAGGRLTGENGSDQPSARMFPSMFNDALALTGLAARYSRSRLFGRADRTWSDPARPARVDWVPGAFALIRHQLFRDLGGFDTRFFLYYEEVDLCRRARALGADVMYWPELVVRHIGGVSARSVNREHGEDFSGNGSQLSLWRMRSGLLYYYKHHGRLNARLASTLELSWHALRALRNRWNHGEDAQRKSLQSRRQINLLRRAWRDTMGGRVAPPTPW